MIERKPGEMTWWRYRGRVCHSLPGARGNRFELAEDIRYAVRPCLPEEGRPFSPDYRQHRNRRVPQDADDAEGLFKAVQRALEKAQEQGGDRVEAAAISLK